MLINTTISPDHGFIVNKQNAKLILDIDSNAKIVFVVPGDSFQPQKVTMNLLTGRKKDKRTDMSAVRKQAEINSLISSAYKKAESLEQYALRIDL